jgi:hypothetical protein
MSNEGFKYERYILFILVVPTNHVFEFLFPKNGH